MRAQSANPPTRRGRTAALLAGAALALAGPLAGAAGAVDGNLYPRPPAGAAAVAPFTHAANGAVHVIAAPAEHIGEGQKWRAHWACDIPGTEIAALRWVARRDELPSALEVEVRAGGARVWAVRDNALSAAAAPFEIPLPPGTCATSLALRQVTGGPVHARRYVVGRPEAIVRDLAPPVVTGVQVPSGWVGAGAAEIAWSVADNLGSEGIGRQHLRIGGLEVWSGSPGQGDHRVAPPIGGLPEGVHTVAVEAQGDGTPAGSAAGPALHVDRTPPAVRSRGVLYPAPGRAAFAVAAADALSGVRSVHVEVNAAGDGSESGPWMEVGSAPGAPDSIDGVDLSGFVQGAHAWRVRAVDHAGNAQVARGAARVLVDLLPPGLAMGALPRTPVSRVPLSIIIDDNLAPLVGLGPTIVSVNAAPDGGRTGRWIPVKTLRLPAGRHAEDVPITGVSDGRHAVLVTVHNGGPFGKHLFGRALGEVVVDTTPPRLERPAFTATGPGRLEVSWIADDALAGVATAAVQWMDRGTWRTLEAQAADDGARSMSVDVSRLPAETAPLRLAVADRAGNVALAAASLDRAGPAVADLALRGGRLVWRQTDPVGGFGACETAVQVNGPGTENEWRELVAERLGAGSQSVRLPVEGLASGSYRVRVVACDAAGNVASATLSGGVRVGSGGGPLGAGSPAVDPFDRLADASLTMRAPGARLERVRGRDVLVRRVRFGESLAVTGRLREATGAAVRGAEVEARGPGGRVVGRGRTGADGRFRMRVRPDAGGPVRVGVPSGDGLFPVRPATALRVAVAPRVHLDVSDLSPATRQPVVFSGRVLPAPRRVGARSKGIVLEWRDPLRGTWRPVVNARTRPDGTFRIGWDFGIGGLSIPIRVRVPEEGGWPLLPALSEQVTVTVG